MNSKIGVAIIGGTGYGAGELLRLIHLHPHLELASIVSSSKASEAVSGSHPHIRDFSKLHFSEKLDCTLLERYERSAIFFALPHGTSANYIAKHQKEIDESKTLIIDLSGDFRLKDSKQRSLHYGSAKVTKEDQEKFIYGLPEMNKNYYSDYTRFATPGCLATVAALAALPLTREETLSLKNSLVFDIKTGSSGAGKKPSSQFHHSYRNENFESYKVLEHRHEAELRETLELDIAVPSYFVPHLLPCSRGCYATLYTEVEGSFSEEEVLKLYEAFYADAPFVKVSPEIPNLNSIVGTNFCDISIKTRSLASGNTQIVVMSALDNLTKGTAGQAIQNLNIKCNLEETCGLQLSALGPSVS